MDHVSLANKAALALLKYAPIPAFIWAGSLSPVLIVQLVLYTIGCVYGCYQIAHLRWSWKNEREDRARKFRKPHTPHSSIDHTEPLEPPRGE